MALTFPLTGYTLVPAVIFDAGWTLIAHLQNERKRAFELLYALQRVEIPATESVPAFAAYVTDNVQFWVEVGAFVISPNGMCADGCKDFVPP